MSATHPRDRTVTAVLGPTNTGKTTYAIERMLGHRTGVMGFPLRLLAREVYDRIVTLRGPSVVALVTGEEKIVPATARYFVCTVESMPVENGADFLAVDEIQLCADPERGHVFTDRLLNARGMHETLFLGAMTMRERIAQLVPGVTFAFRERFSVLSWGGPKKISRLPPRSAVVAFSTDQVYAIGELIRRQKGGAAIVMGALSPRTRNAQVAMFQEGEVEYLVATDAIGMGLNLDLKSVWFAGSSKFDGRKHRRLEPQELAQIAGRAGRYQEDGTFGVTGDCHPFDPEVIEAIEEHRFRNVGALQWRNARLNFGSPGALIGSLDRPSPGPGLQRAREGEDLAALRMLARDPDVQRLAREPRLVKLLWEVCQIPDFRKTMHAEHVTLLERIYGYLAQGRRAIPADWFRKQVERIDRTDGDIDVLSKRLAYIRTWTYCANRPGWVEDQATWRERTRAVEDRISDALHARLTQRFVDRRTSVLMRRLKQKEELVAEVEKDGAVTVEGEHVGRIEGLRFLPDASAEGVHGKALRAASGGPVAAELTKRVERMYAGPDGDIELTEQGGLIWDGAAVGRLEAGADALSPRAVAFADDMLEATSHERATKRLQQWVDRRVQTLFEPLIALRDDASIEGIGRGVAFQLVEALGVLPRQPVSQDVKAIEQPVRAAMRKHGLRFGQHTLFVPALLKPAPTRLRIVLWGLSQGMAEIPSPPPPGVVTLAAPEGVPDGWYPMAGYRKAGERAIRIDMLERLADMIRPLDARGGFEASAEMLSITGLSLEQFAALMDGLGYRGERGERPKMRPARPDEAAPPAGAEAEPAAAVADDPGMGAEFAAEPAPQAPAAVDEVMAGGAEALGEAPLGTVHAEGDLAVIEAVEADGPRVDDAPERPVPADPGEAGPVIDDAEPMAANVAPAEPPAEADALAEAVTLGEAGGEGGSPQLDAVPAEPPAEPVLPATPVAVADMDEALPEAPPPPAAEEAPMAPPAVDAVVDLDNPGAALGMAPEATAYAEADVAAIEGVETGLADVDRVPERPDGAMPVSDAAEPMAANVMPASAPAEAEGKQVEVELSPMVETGETEVFWTFRLAPRNRRPQRGGGGQRNRGQGQQGRREEGEPKGRRPGRGDQRAEGGGRKPGKDHGKPPRRPKGEEFRGGGGGGQRRGGAREPDPDSPFAVLQRLKDGK